MAVMQYTAKVKSGRLLELPESAQELGLEPGEEIEVIFDHFGKREASIFPTNIGMLTALLAISELNAGSVPFSDASNTPDLLNEARSGAMYGYDSKE